MKKFITKMGYKFQRFMQGRYATDELWRALIIFYLITIIAASIVRRFSAVSYWALYILSIVIIVFALYRVFSKNIEMRRYENQKWLKFTGGIKQKFKLSKNKWAQRKTHKFVKCKNCKTVLRLPKHKGKINVTCPHCKKQFIVSTGKKTNN